MVELSFIHTVTQEFSHLNQAGQANMVDVTDKTVTQRIARAGARVVFNAEVLDRIISQGLDKGDLFATARIAGIQGAKRCSELIPLCHPLPLTKVTVEIEQSSATSLSIVSECRTTGQTGVEMEALTAASVAALTIYDMCKAVDKGIQIEQVQLLSKSGGKSGDWSRADD